MNIQEIIKKTLDFKQGRKYLILLLFCGIILMLLPTTSETKIIASDEAPCDFDLEREEKRLEYVLSSIEGVRHCKVLLSVSNGSELVLAETQGEIMIVSKGNEEEPITLLTRSPIYRGAVIVIGGYSDANIRFDVLSAVMSYTGLSTDKITICPMEE